jgi:ubiquinol-cytochrome c reductase cytochrome b subunit
MPIYTRWEKTKPVPKRLSSDHGECNCLLDLKAAFEDITTVKSATTHNGIQLPNGATVTKRGFNAKGLLNVIIRFAKKLKASLD